MKKIKLFLFILCLLFAGCKYEDGPMVSFIEAKYRVTGNYKLEKFYVNGVDTSNYYNSIICSSGFSFTMEGSDKDPFIRPYLPTYTTQCPYDFVGRWKLSDKNNILTIGFYDNIPVIGPWGQSFPFDWTIIKLTDDEMHLGGKSFETTYRLEFKKI